MTRDDIIRMAVKCQLVNASNREGLYMDALAEFAELVAEAEREACAKVCDEYDVAEAVCSSDTAECIAAAIRARGQV